MTLRSDPGSSRSSSLGCPLTCSDEKCRRLSLTNHPRNRDLRDSLHESRSARCPLHAPTVPLAGVIFEPSLPLRQVGTVLGMPGGVLRLDESEASVRKDTERFGVMVTAPRLPSGACSRRGLAKKIPVTPTAHRGQSGAIARFQRPVPTVGPSFASRFGSTVRLDEGLVDEGPHLPRSPTTLHEVAEMHDTPLRKLSSHPLSGLFWIVQAVPFHDSMRLKKLMPLLGRYSPTAFHDVAEVRHTWRARFRFRCSAPGSVVSSRLFRSTTR